MQPFYQTTTHLPLYPSIHILYIPSAKPCGNQPLEEAAVGVGRGGLTGWSSWGEVVHDCRSRPPGAVGVRAPSRSIAGEVGVTVHGGYSRVQVWCGSASSLWSSTGGGGGGDNQVTLYVGHSCLFPSPSLLTASSLPPSLPSLPLLLSASLPLPSPNTCLPPLSFFPL